SSLPNSRETIECCSSRVAGRQRAANQGRKGLPIQPTAWIITILLSMSTRIRVSPLPQPLQAQEVAFLVQIIFSGCQNLTYSRQFWFVQLPFPNSGVSLASVSYPLYRKTSRKGCVDFPRLPGM